MIYGFFQPVLLPATMTGNPVTQVLISAYRPSVLAYIPLEYSDIIIKGGPILIPVIILLILGIYIFIERNLAISRAAKDDNNFMNNIRDFLHNGRPDSALSFCRNNSTPISRMIEKGILRRGRQASEIEAAVDTSGSLEIAKLEKGFWVLATISGAAPMLGFLGTALGMVQVFSEMSAAGKNIDIQILSGGIYQAMITTIAGLIVGIVAYISYNILVARVRNTLHLLQFRASEFIDMLLPPAN
ncbi:MAG: MotA/TolQ/ExbB proton channel family protein [Bacteroidota bacterium]